jgi:NAD binding domain of 6-phosphogluconate dehydrogenase
MLNTLVNKIKDTHKDCLKNIWIIGFQHLLETTGSMIESLCELGVDPKKIFLQGKLYSSNNSVVNRLRELGIYVHPGSNYNTPGNFKVSAKRDIEILWEKVSSLLTYDQQKIIILDDGGICRQNFPRKLYKKHFVCSVEQTTSGLFEETFVPIINIAKTQTKSIYEAPMIANAVLDRAFTQLPLFFPANTKVAVIGTGNIGAAMVKALQNNKFSTFVFDKNSSMLTEYPENIRLKNTINALEKCDVVFGCTGRDIIPEPLYEKIKFMPAKKTFLFSCSSGDIEFQYLLSKCSSNNKHILDNMFVKTAPHLQIMRGGFPINFDNSPESVPSSDIQLTRCLLLAGIFQATLAPRMDPNSKVMLDQTWQNFINNMWNKKK